MTYFAIGESTGGAGERRLGPFPTPEEAAQAGRKETRESNGGFVFRGVVDEANNQVGFDIEPIVSTNSVVRNAIAVNKSVARNTDDFNVKLEQIAKKYFSIIGVALSSVESFKREAGRYSADVVVAGDCDDAIQALRTIKEWCKIGATYGFDD